MWSWIMWPLYLGLFYFIASNNLAPRFIWPPHSYIKRGPLFIFPFISKGLRTNNNAPR